MSAKQKRTKPARPAKFVPITIADPRAPAILRAANEYIAGTGKPARRKREARVTMTADRLSRIGDELNLLSADFAAVRRLSWEMQDGDRELSNAAASGVEALCIVARLKADYLASKLNDPALGRFGNDIVETILSGGHR